MLNLCPGDRLCPKCAIRVAEVVRTGTTVAAEASSPENTNSPGRVFSESALESMNACLDALGETPLSRKRTLAKRAVYAKRKLRNVQTKVRKNLEESLSVSLEDVASSDDLCDEYKSLLSELKTVYMKTTSHARKVSILTLSPSKWSREKVCDFFGASDRMARQAKELRRQKGPLSEPERVLGRTLSQEVKNLP